MSVASSDISDLSNDQESSQSEFSGSEGEPSVEENHSDAENQQQKQKDKTTTLQRVESTQEISLTIQVITDGIAVHWFRVDVTSDDAPGELLKLVKAELNKPSCPCKIANIGDYQLFNFETSRFLKMYLQSISANNITQAKNRILFMNKFININLVLPNFTIYKKRVDGSEKILETLSTIGSQLGITCPEEFGFFEADTQLCDYSKLPVHETVTPEDLRKFELPDHNLVKDAGFKLTPIQVQSKQHFNLISYHRVQKAKYMLNMSLIEQGVTDGMFVVLRFDSTSMVQVFTSSETVRRNLICHQIYSDILNRIYVPGDNEECYNLAGNFLAVNYASLQKHQLDPRSHTFKDEFKEAILYLVENGGKCSSKINQIELHGNLIEFKQKDHPLHKIVKGNNKCSIRLTESGMNLELSSMADPTLKVDISNVELSPDFTEYALPSKEAKVKNHKKELAVKFSSMQYQFTFKPDYEENNETVINFVTALELLHISSQSEIQHVDFGEAENVIKSHIASKSESYAKILNTNSLKTSKESFAKELVINDESKYLNKDSLQTNVSSQTINAAIKKVADKMLQESMQVDKNIIRLISHVTCLQNYLNAVVLSKNHLDSIISNNNPVYRQTSGKQSIKPQDFRFSIVFYTAYIKITFVKPSGDKYSKIPTVAKVPLKYVKGWKFDSAIVTILIQKNEKHASFIAMMQACGIEPENERYGVVAETEEGLPYLVHQLIAERILQSNRKSNKRDTEKLSNYLNRGSGSEKRRYYNNPLLNEESDSGFMGSRRH